MTDPLEALRSPITPVEPDPIFAARLRDRLRRALLAPQGGTMTTTVTTTTSARPEVGRLSPYLIVDGARRALDWYAEALGTRLSGEPYVMPDGRIGHAELMLGDERVMLADEFPELDLLGPLARGGSTVSLHLQVPDVDAVVQRAVELGATMDRPVADEPYGRRGTFDDPFGHRWMVLTPPAPAEQTRLRQGDVGYLSLWLPDVERATGFYGEVLGWHYAPGTHREQGRQVTGLSQRIGLWGGQEHRTVMPCFYVDDVADAVRRLRDAGGRAEEPHEEPYGLITQCDDGRGLTFALLESSGERPAAGPPSHGEVSYLTLEVTDSARARALFGAVLGWDFAAGRVADGWQVTLPDGDAHPPAGMHGGHERATVVPMFAVDDIAAAVERVRAAGGTATDPEQQPYGQSSSCTDDQGTRFWLGQH